MSNVREDVGVEGIEVGEAERPPILHHTARGVWGQRKVFREKRETLIECVHRKRVWMFGVSEKFESFGCAHNFPAHSTECE